MHPRRLTPIWSRNPVRAALLIAPVFLFGAAMAVVQKGEARTQGSSTGALAPEESGTETPDKRTPSTRRAVMDAANGAGMPAPKKLRAEAPGVFEAPRPAEDLPPFARRYLAWGAEELCAEATNLEQRVQTLAQARCALLLGTSEATDDRGDAPAGVYARGDGKRYRLPESDHADLYDLLTEAKWLRQRAESR